MPDEKAYNLTAYDADTGKQVFYWFQVAPNHQFVAGDVIDHDSAVGIPVVHRSQRLVSLLTGSIPNFKLDRGALIEGDGLCQKVDQPRSPELDAQKWGWVHENPLVRARPGYLANVDRETQHKLQQQF